MTALRPRADAGRDRAPSICRFAAADRSRGYSIVCPLPCVPPACRGFHDAPRVRVISTALYVRLRSPDFEGELHTGGRSVAGPITATNQSPLHAERSASMFAQIIPADASRPGSSAKVRDHDIGAECLPSKFAMVCGCESTSECIRLPWLPSRRHAAYRRRRGV